MIHIIKFNASPDTDLAFDLLAIFQQKNGQEIKITKTMIVLRNRSEEKKPLKRLSRNI